MTFKYTLDFAKYLDTNDPLASYKEQFHFPQHKGENVIYFTGNSLGLQPKRTQKYIDEVLKDWREMGVEGHFHSDKPWWDYHERFAEPLSKIVGALPSEVSVMNTLTVNLHLLMVSFYQPTKERYKIICEAKAFPSDQYMLASQLRFHGYTKEEALIEVSTKEESNYLRTEDILEIIEKEGDQCAVLLMGGVNYYSGQVLDIQRITKAAKAKGIKVGWDLAHAVGNVALSLHDWEVDFAAWCSYKYMNSGPGSVSGYFVHEQYHNQKDIPRFEGWWGHHKEQRFMMAPEFVPEPNANAWQVSNTPIFSLAPYLASLTMFEEVGMSAIIKKRKLIVSYLEFILLEIAKKFEATFEIITPIAPEERGTQLSVYLHGFGRKVFDELMNNGVVVDWREPNVIRLAPVALYCSYEDMYYFGKVLEKALTNSRK